MVTGEIRAQIDRIWDAFWAGGIANPLGSMNMLLHGVENPDIRYRDSLAQDHAGEEEKYTRVMANPPFAGSLDHENCAKDLQ